MIPEIEIALPYKLGKMARHKHGKFVLIQEKLNARESFCPALRTQVLQVIAPKGRNIIAQGIALG